MFINIRVILRLPVSTQSGVKLGKVYDINFDVESHSVREYIVKENFLSKQTLLIKPNQVKEITLERMVVDDCFVKEKKVHAVKSKTQPAGAFASAMLSK